jgi:hypothetical protein
MRIKRFFARLTGALFFLAALAEIANFASSQQSYIQNVLTYGEYLFSQYFPSQQPRQDIAPRKRTWPPTANMPCKNYGFRIVKPNCKLEKSTTKRMLCKLKPGKGEIYCRNRGQ